MPDATATLDDIAGLLRELVANTRPAPAMLDREELARLLTIGTSSLDVMRAAKKVGPAEIRLGGSLRWRRDEVAEWIANPGPDGELLNAKEWSAFWAAKQRQK